MSLIDERIVKMVFDNTGFESKVSSTIGSLTKLNQATDEIGNKSGGLSSLRDAFEQTEITATKAGFHIHDVWLKVASIFEYQIAGKIVSAGKNIANALTMEGITDGFKEYELKMGSIQTIMAGTGESLATVNRQLDELNKYSDQTIYSFSDMTNNIGKFTNAGVKLDDAVAAIKGIANEAAISGANANEASRAMYNFSQALSAGYVKLIDWKSIENANMATKGFKETLLEVASAVGTVEKDADGMYKILTTNAQGKVMDELVSGTKNFNDSLQQQWMTTDVLTQALKIYATNVEDLTGAEKAAYEQELKNLGFDDEQIKNFEELGTKATKAASEIKTFTMLMDTLKEAIGSGWAMTWQYIIGDFEQAKALWTDVGNVLGGVIDSMSDARNVFIKGGLQTGWEKLTTMTGAAIPEAEKFRDVLLDVARAHGALDEETIEGINNTEDFVASMHELGWVTGPMVTEAIDSYLGSLERLTDEERAEMGITEADIAGLKQLQEQFRHGTLDADEFAESMNKLGGRENIIEGIRNAFHALVDVLKPIKDGFRDIFPPATSDSLYKLTERFKEFTDKLKVGEELADKIRRTSKGFFAIFDIAGKLISSFVKAILPAGDGILALGDDLLTVTADIGDFIVGLDETITKNKTFEKAFEGVSKVIKKISEVIRGFSIEGFKQKIQVIFDYFKSVDTGSLSSIGDFFKKIADDFAGGLDDIKEKLAFLKPLAAGIKSLFEGVVSVIGEVFQKMGDAISGVSVGGNGIGFLQNIFNALLSGGILYKLFSGAKTFSNIGDVLESVGGAFESFSKKIESENLLSIAKAVAILAGSLFIVAMIDEDKLLGATTAISTMVGVMAGAMAVLMKAVNSFSTNKVQSTFSIFGKSIFGTDAVKMFEMSRTLNAVSKALIAMGTAILLMSVGLKIVSTTAESGHLWDSFAVISLMLAELVGVTILLGKFGKDGDKGAKNLTKLTTALVIMSGALAIVAQVVQGGNAWEALAIVSIMLAELGGIAILVEKFGKYQLGSMAGLIALAVSLAIVVYAVKQVSDALGEEGQHIWEALGVCALILAALAGVTILLGTFGGGAVLGGAGAIMAAAALLIVVQALKQVSDLLGETDQHVWQSLGVIAAALAILAVGLMLMTATIPGAAALIIASAGLVVLGVALKVLSTMDMAAIGRGLLAMGASLLILAVGLTAMIAALPGAVALVVAAAGLTILAGVLKVLGGMNLEEIGHALLMLFTSLLGLAVIGTVLSVVSPLLLIFGAAILALGVGLIAVGTGLTVFSAGLQALVAVLPMGIQALQLLGEVVGGLILKAIETLCDAIGLIAEKIVEYGPQISEALLALLTILLEVLVNAVPQISAAGYEIVIGLINVFTEKIPELAQAGTDMIIAFIQAISTEIPRITDEAMKCAIALINGLADAITENNPALIEAVDNLMDAVIQAITQWLVKFTPLGLLMSENTKDGILSGEIDVKNAIGDVIRGAIDKIKEFVGDFRAAAENLIAGFVEGFKSSWAGKAIEEAASFASNIVSSMNSKKGFDEHSPSKKSRQSAVYFIQGFINGMNEAAPQAYKASQKFASNVSLALETAMEAAAEMADQSLEVSPVITPVLDLSNLRSGANVANNLLAGQSMSLASQISFDYDQNGRTSTSTAEGVEVSGIGGTTFIQNNYSPKALSRIEIYRDTRNLFAQAKGALS